MRLTTSIHCVLLALCLVGVAPCAHASDIIMYIADSSGNIGQVDITTQSVVAGSVHSTGLGLTDIGFTSNGNLYGTTFTGLYLINPSTGAATTIGTYGSEGGMNALVGNGTNLLGASSSDTTVYAVNPATAALSTYATSPAYSAGDLAFSGTTLYESAVDLTSGYDELVNVTTNTIIGDFHVGSLSGAEVDGLFGLADNGTTMYAVNGTAVYSVNLSNGVLTALFDYSGNGLGSANGSAFIAEGPPPVQGALLFVPMTPCRLVDTRDAAGAFGGPSIAGNTSRSFAIPSSACDVPSTAAAYSLNVTAVPKAGLGYMTIWPTGVTQPVVSTLNSDGRVKANAAIVPAGTSGAVSVYATDATDVVLDINGYFVPATSTSALAFYPLTPCRVVDTRNPTGTLGGPSLVGAQTRAFPILSSACNIPSTAQAYSLNFTAIPQDGLGYLSAWPTGQTWPGVSTLNAPTTNPVVANAAIVPAGTTGQINVLGSNNTDVVIDINGYFAPVGAAAGSQALYTVTPCRVLDTRSSSGSFNGTLPVNVAGSSCGVPSSAEAFVLNATVVPTLSLGYLTLWPENETQPVVSTLNADDGVIASNMAIVPTTNGSIDAFSSNSTQLILDISGYFAPSSTQ